jgi:NADPH-dependent glutamate synthase beta subunit-like oxidoreductase
LPETCGKVCTRRCEEVCSIAKRGEPVAIRWLKRYATERAANADMIKEIVNPVIAPPNGYKVAVIGAGPAGLTVGYYLALRGFDITIYERNPQPGGMTMYGIPKYRLPIDSLRKQVEYMEKIGVKIHYNTEVGKDISFEELYNNFDAVFIGVGLQKAWKLGIEGEDLEGSWGAIHFLRKVNMGEKVEVGDKVVVVGGGNTAIDAARVSRRLGAEVIMLYRRRKVDMPADWEEIEDAEAEGVQIWTQGVPVKIIGDEKGHVKYLRYVKTKMVPNPKGGRPKPVPIEGSESDIEVSTVIAAIGQDADYTFIPEKFLEKIQFNRGRIVVNEWGQTGDPKVFAGGDAVNRVADAISAIADGYRAVKGIVRLLLGEEALKK